MRPLPLASRDGRPSRAALLLALCLVPPPARAAAVAPADEDCRACHEEPAAPVSLSDSVHGQASLSCTDCHADLAGLREFPHAERLRPAACGSCHEEAARRYSDGIHARARAASPESAAAACSDCHGSHGILPAADPRSATHHLVLPRTCGRCHGDSALVAAQRMGGGIVPAEFEDSIHGQALRRKGLVVAPNCSSCHKSHDVRRAADTESPVHREAIPATCGTCHEGIRREYETSVHWSHRTSGGAVCSDCHSAHGIAATGVAAWRLEAVRECGTCHEARVRSYRDGFHGKITALGYARVATCADCHGAHGIRRGSDPESMVHGARLAGTCARCHPGAGASFARYDPHADPDDRERSLVLYYTRFFMEMLLAGVFAFFFVHTALWFPRSLAERRRAGREPGASR